MCAMVRVCVARHSKSRIYPTIRHRLAIGVMREVAAFRRFSCYPIPEASAHSLQVAESSCAPWTSFFFPLVSTASGYGILAKDKQFLKLAGNARITETLKVSAKKRPPSHRPYRRGQRRHLASYFHQAAAISRRRKRAHRGNENLRCARSSVNV